MRNVCILFACVGLLAISVPAQEEAAPSTQDGPLNVKPAPPALDKDGVYRVGPGITSPMLTNPVAPEVPSTADDRVPSLHFQFQVVVGADGSIKFRDVFPDSPSRFLDNAITAVKHSTFQAGSLNGLPVPVLVCVGVAYSPWRPPSTRIIDCDQERMRRIDEGLYSGPPVDDPFKLPAGASPPRPTRAVVPEYSDEARRAGYEGAGLVSLIVNEEGMPTEIHVERHLDYGLDDKMIEAVSKTRFQPATLNGKPIAARIRIEVSFRMRN
jgi:TonB family protein